MLFFFFVFTAAFLAEVSKNKGWIDPYSYHFGWLLLLWGVAIISFIQGAWITGILCLLISLIDVRGIYRLNQGIDS